MTPAEREAKLRALCQDRSACDEERAPILLDSAKSDAERAKLERLWKQLDAVLAAKAKANESRVCCCDGTVSPTCTTAHRGCCSHHGGVCGCN